MAYHLECPDNCSLRDGTRWGQRATELLEEGRSYLTIIGLAKTEGYALNGATLSRHKKHVVPDVMMAADETERSATNIEILEAIISKGFANRKNWKPTIGDTMKAMDMWFRLTQGNPFDDLLDTLAQASIHSEDPAAESTPSEQETLIDTGG